MSSAILWEFRKLQFLFQSQDLLELFFSWIKDLSENRFFNFDSSINQRMCGISHSHYHLLLSRPLLFVCRPFFCFCTLLQSVYVFHSCGNSLPRGNNCSFLSNLVLCRFYIFYFSPCSSVFRKCRSIRSFFVMGFFDLCVFGYFLWFYWFSISFVICVSPYYFVAV